MVSNQYTNPLSGDPSIVPLHACSVVSFQGVILINNYFLIYSGDSWEQWSGCSRHSEKQYHIIGNCRQTLSAALCKHGGKTKPCTICLFQTANSSKLYTMLNFWSQLFFHTSHFLNHVHQTTSWPILAPPKKRSFPHKSFEVAYQKCM